MKMKNMLGVVTALTLMMSTTVLAETTYTNNRQPIVYSKEFPDAYIIVEMVENKKQSKADGVIPLDTVQATVFVEDTYEVVDGENTLVESRLLSKSEIDQIGVENFNKHTRDSGDIKMVQRGKLLIVFGGDYELVGNGVEIELHSFANWLEDEMFDSGSPASGEDFMGITWSGGHTVKSTDIVSEYSNKEIVPIRLAYGKPNMARVWAFAEDISDAYYNGYMKKLNINMTLAKNTLEGNGNTSEAILQYTHTYQKLGGGISISDNGVGFNLEGVDKQWTIACEATGIPY